METSISVSLKTCLENLFRDSLVTLAQELFMESPSIFNEEKKDDLFKEVHIEFIREEKFGDYSCTSAMDKKNREFYAKANPNFRNPRFLAKAICEIVQKKREELCLIEKIEIAGAGFINITIRNEALGQYLIQLKKGKTLQFLLPEKERQKIIFEYVSANPTGPLNVVSARVAALGDTCCNLLEVVGHKVKREYYVNDYGNQVTLLGQSAFLRYLESEGCQLKFGENGQEQQKQSLYKHEIGLPFPQEAYHGKYIQRALEILRQKEKKSHPLLSSKLIEQMKKLSAKKNVEVDFFDEANIKSNCEKLGKSLLELLLHQQKETLRNFRVNFDQYFHESDLHKDPSILENVKRKLSTFLYEKEGTVFFKSTVYGDDKDRVIIRSDGRPTYFFADIAYHADKIKRDFTHIYNIWGPDHHGYIPRLQGAIQALDYKGSFRVIISQQVNLLEDGETVRMSKRAGRLVTLKELIEEIPIDPLRYFFSMYSFQVPMDFDMAFAKDTSEKNPYYYVAYAHARICSIFRKANEKGIPPISHNDFQNALCNANKDWEWTPQRRKLVLQVIRFSDEIQAAANHFEPHRVTHLIYSLANIFSQFYASKENRVIEQAPVTASCLVTLLELVAFCLKTGLDILGTKAPTSMFRKETSQR